MLIVDFDREKEMLYIQFELPLPASMMENSEVQHLLAELKNTNGGNFFWEEEKLQRFSVPLSDRDTFIKHILSPEKYLVQKDIFAQLRHQEKVKQLDGLEINFHQRPFDTPERYWNFIINQGNFIDYFFNRINWDLGPKRAIITPFPLHVDIESANTCNMNCPMCYNDQIEEKGQMDIDVFKKAIDECAANDVFSIRLSWRGETLTHPRIKEMIAYATSKIKNVSFLTNAFYIDEEMSECFINNKLSYVSVSFDGIGEVYEAIRYPAKFEENYKNLALLQKKKKESGSLLPQVRVCTIWPAIKDDPDAYYQMMNKVSDYIVCNPYINFAGPMTLKPDFMCQYPWERIVIAFNGKTQCCTGWNASDIILGNVKEKTIHEMWHSDLLNNIRKLHAEGRRMELTSCANCRHGSKGDPNISIQDIVERRF